MVPNLRVGLGSVFCALVDLKEPLLLLFEITTAGAVLSTSDTTCSLLVTKLTLKWNSNSLVVFEAADVVNSSLDDTDSLTVVDGDVTVQEMRPLVDGNRHTLMSSLAIPSVDN